MSQAVDDVDLAGQEMLIGQALDEYWVRDRLISLAAFPYTVKVQRARGTALLAFLTEFDAREYWTERFEDPLPEVSEEVEAAALYGPGIDEVLARYQRKAATA